MFWRTRQGEQNWLTQTHHDHDHDDHHHHHNHGEAHHHHHEHDHDHDHNHAALAGLSEGSKAYQDAHERAHATDIQRRFAGKEVTNGQILLFGLTGGLIPCPAAITVLLICIQLKAFTLGATMVLCFSLGLALTLVTVGVGAAISVQQAAKRWSGFNTLARKAPIFPARLSRWSAYIWGFTAIWGSSVNEQRAQQRLPLRIKPASLRRSPHQLAFMEGRGAWGDSRDRFR